MSTHLCFQALGDFTSITSVTRLLQSVDRDGSAEIEFPEFVEIMTAHVTTSTNDGNSKLSAGAAAADIQLMATAYRSALEGLK